jgi:hypothetical protein
MPGANRSRRGQMGSEVVLYTLNTEARTPT